MEHSQRISAIRARALKVGLSLRSLSAGAGLNPSTISRWERADANPGMRLFADAMDRLEAALEAHERALLAELAALHPDVVRRRAA